jgi:DNA-binding GntR family transcriptional regulator
VQLPSRSPERKRQTAQAYVRDSIREQIFSGELTAGDRLVQAAVAVELNVSTTPVREALRELATEGLLKLDTHRGAVVRELSSKDLRDIHEIRAVLEPLAMRGAVERISEEQLDEAQALHEAMLTMPAEPEWAELNRDFHGVFLDACGSERLAQIVRTLQNGYAAYVVALLRSDPSRRDRSNKEHESLLEATRAGDADLAVEILLKHIFVPVASADGFDGVYEGLTASG